MGSSENHYLLTAIVIVRSHLFLFLLPVCIFTAAYIPLVTGGVDSGDMRGSWMLLSLAGNISLFVLYPIIYGLFLDITARRPRRSWGEILRTDWLNYFLVSMVLGAPVFLIARLGPMLDLSFNAPELVATLLSQWLSIYSVPMVFFTQKRLVCISFGYKCLAGNFHFSRHLIWLTTAAVIFNYAAMQLSEGADTLQRGVLGLVIIFITMGIDLVVFIAATLVLQEKVFNHSVS